MLELRDVHAGYDGHPVLHGVDLRVPQGSVVALLGPNGAGKSTLLRVASGELKPTSGRVVLHEKEVTKWPPHRRARAGLCHVPEGRGVFPSLSVSENIRLQGHSGVAEPIAVAVGALPMLADRLDQTAGTMSGGQQQALALARAYVSEPSVVLVDEPSMGLAPKIVDEVFEHLGALAASGASLLLVEQYVTRALALADYVYVLQKGRVAFVGEPRELDDSQLKAAYLGDLV